MTARMTKGQRMKPSRFTIEKILTSGNTYDYRIVESKTGIIYVTCYDSVTADICLKAMNKSL